jgi:hypothetical protein
VPLSTAVDVDVFPSDLAAGGASGLEARSAKSGFSGLAGGLYSWYFTSRGLFFFGAAKASRLDRSNINRQKREGETQGNITDGESYTPVCGKRKAESEGRTPEEEEAGEELTVLASGASVGSSLWLLSCLGGGELLCEPKQHLSDLDLLLDERWGDSSGEE